MLKSLHRATPAGRRRDNTASGEFQPSLPAIVGKRRRSLTPPNSSPPKTPEISRPALKYPRLETATHHIEGLQVQPSSPPPLTGTTVAGRFEPFILSDGPIAGNSRAMVSALDEPSPMELSDKAIAAPYRSSNDPSIKSDNVARKRNRSLTPPYHQPQPAIRKVIPTPRPPAKRTRLALPESPSPRLSLPLSSRKRFGSTFQGKNCDQIVSQKALLAQVMQSQNKDAAVSGTDLGMDCTPYHQEAELCVSESNFNDSSTSPARDGHTEPGSLALSPTPTVRGEENPLSEVDKLEVINDALGTDFSSSSISPARDEHAEPGSLAPSPASTVHGEEKPLSEVDKSEVVDVNAHELVAGINDLRGAAASPPLVPPLSEQSTASAELEPSTPLQTSRTPSTRVAPSAIMTFAGSPALAASLIKQPTPQVTSDQGPLPTSTASVQHALPPQAPLRQIETAALASSTTYFTLPRSLTMVPAPQTSSGQGPPSAPTVSVLPVQLFQAPPSQIKITTPQTSSGQSPPSAPAVPVLPAQSSQVMPSQIETVPLAGLTAYAMLARSPTMAPTPQTSSDQGPSTPVTLEQPIQPPHVLSSRTGITVPTHFTAYPMLARPLATMPAPQVPSSQGPSAPAAPVQHTQPSQTSGSAALAGLAYPIPARPSMTQPSSSQIPPSTTITSLQPVQPPFLWSSTPAVSLAVDTAQPSQPMIITPVHHPPPSQLQPATPLLSSEMRENCNTGSSDAASHDVPMACPSDESEGEDENENERNTHRRKGKGRQNAKYMHEKRKTNLTKAMEHLQQSPDALDVGIPLDTSSGSRNAASSDAERDVPMADPLDEDENERQGSNQRRDKRKHNDKFLPHSRNAFETYEHLINNPDDPCTNAALATVLEVVVDLKSVIQTDLKNIRKSAAPQAGDDKNGRRGRTPATPKRTFHAQRQDKSVTNLQRDIHQLAKELLNIPEDCIRVPTPDELRLYAMKHPDAVGPQLEPFVLDLASKGLSSPWNKRASSIFATEFLSRKIYHCIDRNAIQNAFRTYLTALQVRYNKQQKVATMSEAARIAELDEKKRSARYARRTYKRHRRCNALNTFSHIPGVDEIITELEQLPVDSMSGDETEYDGDEESYLVKTRCEWRSKDADNLFEVCDALDLSTRFDSDDRPDKGRFPDPRIVSYRRDGRPVPPRLPQNLYSAEYRETLTASEREGLYMRPSFEFIIPTPLLQKVSQVNIPQNTSFTTQPPTPCFIHTTYHGIDTILPEQRPVFIGPTKGAGNFPRLKYYIDVNSIEGEALKEGHVGVDDVDFDESEASQWELKDFDQIF